MQDPSPQRISGALRLGDVLPHPVYGRMPGNPAPVLLLAAGQRIETEAQLRVLQQAGYPVLLPGEQEKGPAHAPASNTPTEGQTSATFIQRLAAAASVRRAIIEASRELLRQVRQQVMPDIPAFLELSAELASQVATDPFSLATLTHLRQCDDYAVEHGADVAILMVAIGHVLHVPEAHLRLLALAGLTHDVGKQRIPLAILNKPGPLSPEEWQQVRCHPEYGYQILSQAPCCPEPIRLVALQHHERYSGGGYPHGLENSAIHPWSRIAAVADVFDAMTADRIYRKGLPARQVLVNLHTSDSRDFDPAAVAALIRLVGVYPVGTRVVLNTGQQGRVVAPNPADTARPWVQVDRDHQGKPLATPYLLAPEHGGPYIVATV